MFYESHPFEVYRDKFLDKFHFEIENDLSGNVNLQLQFPFGIKGKDNGNILDPDDRGHLEFDGRFEVLRPGSQQWLADFCAELLDDELTFQAERYRCFFDVVADVVTSAQCSYPEFNVSLSAGQCCGNDFPLSSDDADVCFSDADFINVILATVNSTNTTLVGTPVYDRDSGDIVAMTHQIETDFVWSAKYSDTDNFYTHWERFMTRQLRSAPRSLKGGWFAGAYGDEFFLYDLQKTMVSGTVSGIALSLGVGFAVMLVTSLNVVITFYAMLTIVFIIAVTVGALVLLGWQLGVLEALVITLTVGLSIDFAIHVAVAYKVSPHSDRASRVEDAITTVGSAVTMAALTTFLSGAAITLGRVMSYYQ